MKPLLIVLIINQLLFLGGIKAISSADQNAILDAERAMKDVPR